MYPVSYVPGWFPGAQFQSFAAQARRLTEKMLEEPMQEVEKAMVRNYWCINVLALIICLEVSGDAKISMTSELLEQSESKQEREDYRTCVRNASSVAYGGQSNVFCPGFRNLWAELFTSGG